MKLIAWALLGIAAITGFASKAIVSPTCPTVCGSWLPWDYFSCQSAMLMCNLFGSMLGIASWGLLAISAVFLIFAWIKR